MKRTIKRLSLLVAITGLSVSLYAQPAPGQQSGGDAVQGNAIGGSGGSAPIGGGLVVLLTLGAAWAGKKVYDARKDMSK